jgi:hypothetical protein
MSLGWLTESAIMPKKAKEITIDSHSIIDLQAELYARQTEAASGTPRRRATNKTLGTRTATHTPARSSPTHAHPFHSQAM